MNVEKNLQSLLKWVSDDKTNGSISITKNLLYKLKSLTISSSQAEISKIIQFFPILKQAKPTMSAIDNILTFIWNEIKQKGQDKISEILNNAILLIEKSTSESIENAIKYCTQKFPVNNLNIVTTSFSSTILSFFKRLKNIKNFKVFALESRFEGINHSLNFIHECIKLNIESEEISYHSFLRENIAFDYAIIGADKIIYNKAVVNGTPSLHLAEGAVILGIPFFVVAESLKISNKTSTTEGFDIVPWNYITRLFTDNIFEKMSFN
ncbi:MAG: hypothetical protein ACUVQ1_06355 [Candidatus Kapaibacteriales bacterium]